MVLVDEHGQASKVAVDEYGRRYYGAQINLNEYGRWISQRTQPKLSEDNITSINQSESNDTSITQTDSNNIEIKQSETNTIEIGG